MNPPHMSTYIDINIEDSVLSISNSSELILDDEEHSIYKFSRHKHDLSHITDGFKIFYEHKKPKTSAEIVYRWISDDVDFVEDHTALSDCLIEVEIYVKCKRKKKRIPESVFVSRS